MRINSSALAHKAKGSFQSDYFHLSLSAALTNQISLISAQRELFQSIYLSRVAMRRVGAFPLSARRHAKLLTFPPRDFHQLFPACRPNSIPCTGRRRASSRVSDTRVQSAGIEHLESTHMRKHVCSLATSARRPLLLVSL
jgi:hypothetical protein